MDNPKIAIVLPIYNEAQNLRPLIAGLARVMDQQGQTYEIIAVDDASADQSLVILKQLAGEFTQLRIIKLKQNSGQSAAFDAGFKIASAEIVVTMDADLQYDPGDIPRLLEQLKDCDMVCGWRKQRQDPWIKLVSTRIANGVRNRLSGENIKDTGCSLKAMKRSFLKDIKMYDGMHRFLPTLLKMKGAQVVEIEVSHFPRKFGRSKYNIRNRLLRSFCDLLFVIWMKKRNLDYKMEVIK